MVTQVATSIKVGWSIKRLGTILLGWMPLVGLANPWQLATVSGLSIRATDLLFVVLWSLWLLHVSGKGAINRRVLLFIGLVLGLYLVAALGVLISPFYRVEWAPFFRFTQTLLWGALALAFITRPRELRVVTKNIVLAGAFLGLSSIYIYSQQAGLHRVAGYFSSAGGAGYSGQASFNGIAALYALAATLSLCYLLWDKRSLLWTNRIMLGVGFALNFIGLILVQSRSGFLAFGVGCLAIFIPETKRFAIYGKLNKRLLGGAAVVVMVGIGIILGSEEMAGVNRLTQTFVSGSSEYHSMVTRLVLWREAFAGWFAETPRIFLGIGFGSGERLLALESAHNFFLNVSLWLGLVGLILVLILLIWPILPLNSNRREVGKAHSESGLCSRFGIAAFSVAMVVSLTGNVLVGPLYGSSTFLVLYGACAARLPSKRAQQGGWSLR
ncbi:hypothetical protein KBTX_01971 [wastewater metagenome]|uniref:O-antigen ligase-related domain-containing protein n=2 Tax=unclassified sequences TaxID=12908 RepID=A0A5B8RCK8_9ZZZZ|nr:O-antigen ligase family protein [Arhodomonas sp. KWT]QEA05648.1 hypothetical protein KBTEX_01971 [uncultured organism]